MLLASGASVNYENMHRETALIHACRASNAETVAALLAGGANVNHCRPGVGTPLVEAARIGSADVVRLLLAHGARCITLNAEQESPVAAAVLSGSADCVAAILSCPDASLEMEVVLNLQQALQGEKEAPLGLNPTNPFFVFLKTASASRQVAGEGDDSEHGADVGAHVSEPTYEPHTPLTLAAMQGFDDIIQMLAARGADLDYPTSAGFTPLMHAARAGQDRALRLLVKLGADPNKEWADRTALIVATAFNQVAAAIALVEGGAAPNAECPASGLTPLVLAAERGHVEACRALVQQGAAVDRETQHGLTALMHAAAAGHAEVLRVLASLGADIHLESSRGTTALVHAVTHAQMISVETLLSLSDNRLPDYETGTANTALLEASSLGYTDIMRTLVAAGDSPGYESVRGMCALHAAARAGNVASIATLVELGASLDQEASVTALTPLMVALLAGQTEAVNQLCFKGCNVNYENKNGYTALSLACSAELMHANMALLELVPDESLPFDSYQLSAITDAIANRADVNAEGRFSHTPLRVAAAAGCRAALRWLVDAGARVDAEAADGYTPLMVTARAGQVAGARTLLELRASVDYESSSLGFTALMVAAKYGRLDVVKELVAWNAAPNYESKKSFLTPLMVAVESNDLQVIAELLNLGASIYSRNAKGFTPLHHAAVVGGPRVGQVVAHLISRGAEIQTNVDGVTPLMSAATAGHVEAALALVSGDALPADSSGGALDVVACVRALYAAVDVGQAAVVDLLLRQGVPLDVEFDGGLTPMMRCTDKENVAAMRLLASRGAALENQSLGGLTPLMYAARGNKVAALQLLLELGADAHAASSRTGDTAMLEAVTHDATDAVLLLVRNGGVDVDAAGRGGDTPLMRAARVGNCGMISTLAVTLKARVNLESPATGRVALMVAAEMGQLEAIASLVQHLAYVDQEGSLGDTPLIVATCAGQLAAMKSLLALQARVNYMTRKGQTALLWAARKGALEAASLLLEHGADVNVFSPQHGTALMVAARAGQVAAVELLVAKGADADAEDAGGLTALAIAATERHTGAMQALLEASSRDRLDKVVADGRTMLARAAEAGDLAVATMLVAHGASVDLELPDGTSVLSLAARSGRVDVLDVLLLGPPGLSGSSGSKACGGQLNREHSRSHVTPLIAAAERGEAHMVMALVRLGADPKYEAADGRTAMLAAAAAGQVTIMHLLAERYGVDINYRNASGQTALMVAAAVGQMEALQAAAALGAQVDAVDSSGATALAASVRQVCAGVEAIMKLVDLGASTATLEQAAAAQEGGHPAGEGHAPPATHLSSLAALFENLHLDPGVGSARDRKLQLEAERFSTALSLLRAEMHRRHPHA
eukprot:jgi/Mesvir1/26658/Mv20447-RA.1